MQVAYARGGRIAAGGGLFAGGPFATGLIAGGLFASGLNAGGLNAAPPLKGSYFSNLKSVLCNVLTFRALTFRAPPLNIFAHGQNVTI